MDSKHSGISVKRRRTQRGATLVIFTLAAAAVLIPMVGLAIDGSVAFWAKAKLSAAVDAASLAAGRNINAQATYSANQVTVQTIANQWFFANFPSGWLGSTIAGGQPTVGYPPVSNGYQTVSISASATVPLYFMRVVGQSSVTVSATAQSSRRNSFIVFVLDRSGSMGAPPVGTGVCSTMQQDAVNFVGRFVPGFDWMSLVTFSSTANSNPIDVTPTQQFVSPMTTAINSLACTGATSTAQALQVAYQTIKKSGLPGGLNAIVLFTDGQPNELVADFPVRTQSDTRYGLYPSYYAPYASQDPYYVYTFTTLYTPAASPCSSLNAAKTIHGGFTTLIDSNNIQPPAVQGFTGGLLDASSQVSISTAPGAVSAPNCYFTQDSIADARWDIAYLPTQDFWLNKTNTGNGANPPYYGANVGTAGVPDTFTSGPYAGKIRPDEQTIGIIAAAINAADYQAQEILKDTTYNPVIYTIGLGGAKDMPVDATLLERIANDPRSPIYDTSRSTGLYTYAPNSTQLNQAFQQVASQILRLSK